MATIWRKGWLYFSNCTEPNPRHVPHIKRCVAKCLAGKVVGPLRSRCVRCASGYVAVRFSSERRMVAGLNRYRMNPSVMGGNFGRTMWAQKKGACPWRTLSLSRNVNWNQDTSAIRQWWFHNLLYELQMVVGGRRTCHARTIYSEWVTNGEEERNESAWGHHRHLNLGFQIYSRKCHSIYSILGEAHLQSGCE